MKVFKQQMNRGFTFIELIIVIAIFGLISSVMLFNSRDFTNNMELESAAQDIALAIKDAQTRAISGSVNELIPLGGKVRYGVMFAKEAGALENPDNQFVLFGDFDPETDGYWDGGVCGSNDECIQIYEINPNIMIDAVCVDEKASLIQGVDIAQCNESLSTSGVSIVFERPFPNAIITTARAGDGVDTIGARQDASITIRSVNGSTTKRIVVWATGQITVE